MAKDEKINKEVLDESTSEYSFSSAWEYFSAFLRDVIDLEKGVDKRNTINEIRDKKSMSGANAWMLMCSIVIASIGLSQNSQAVIIGGMLISPLMAPILGIGLSVGINDMDTLRTSLIHFGAAILIAIFTSTLYFMVFDFPEITSEIQSRTRPTFLDIFVAIFGGVAGIISIARKDISVTLPGVAIATALMPPLCVTGYGIANWDYDIAAKSFYLFFLNTFFVSLATYIIVRFLRFPFTQYVESSKRRRNSAFIVFFSLILIIPSIFIFRGVIRDAYKQAAINSFYRYCLGDKQKFLDSYQLYQSKDGQDILYLKCYGDQISSYELPQYQECLAGFGLENVSIEILSSSEVNLDQFTGLEKNIKDLDDQLKVVKAIKQEQATYIKQLKENTLDSVSIAELNKELKILYPELLDFSIGKVTKVAGNNYNPDLPVIQTNWATLNSKKENFQRITKFVQQRMGLDTLLSY